MHITGKISEGGRICFNTRISCVPIGTKRHLSGTIKQGAQIKLNASIAMDGKSSNFTQWSSGAMNAKMSTTHPSTALISIISKKREQELLKLQNR